MSFFFCPDESEAVVIQVVFNRDLSLAVFKKAGVAENLRYVKEVRTDASEDLAAGTEITANKVLRKGDEVKVISARPASSGNARVWIICPHRRYTVRRSKLATIKPCEKCAKRGAHCLKYKPGIIDWVRKASQEAANGVTIVALLPARTDSRWFQTYVLPYAELRWVKGRLKFGGHKTSALFPSVVAVYRPRPKGKIDVEGFGDLLKKVYVHKYTLGYRGGVK